MPSTPPLTDEPPWPPLAISHLLVLTLTTSFALAYFAPIIAEVAKTPSQVFEQSKVSKPWTIGSLVVVALAAGMNLFGFAVVVREVVARRSLRWLSVPHWFFVIAALQLLLGIAHQTFNQYLSGNEGWHFWSQIISAGKYLAWALLWFAVTMRTGARAWQTVAVLMGLTHAGWFAFYAHRAIQVADRGVFIHPMHFFGPLGSLHAALLLGLAVAVMLEWKTSTRRDWLHHLGIAMILVDSLGFFESIGSYCVRWWSSLYFHVAM